MNDVHTAEDHQDRRSGRNAASVEPIRPDFTCAKPAVAGGLYWRQAPRGCSVLEHPHGVWQRRSESWSGAQASLTTDVRSRRLTAASGVQ
jgi:hypothetical protein